MMKPDKQDLIMEGNETERGSTVKEDKTLPHKYANKSCDVGSLTIQSLNTSNCDTSPEKRILPQGSVDDRLNPNKLCRYSYMDCTSRSKRLPPGDIPNETDIVVLERTDDDAHGGKTESRLNQSVVNDSLSSKSNVENKNITDEVLFINNLPRSLLVHIFSMLKMRDILNHAACVCKLWYSISKDPDLWRSIRLEDSHEYLRITDCILDRVTSLSNNISSILLSDCSLVTDSGLSSVLTKCSNLRILHLLQCSRLTDMSYTSIADHCHRLKKLNLSGSVGLTDVALQRIACSCRQLEQVKLNQCTQITDKSTQVLAIKCPNIELITFQENNQVTDASVEALSSHCKSLHSITIHKCSLSINGFFHLSKIPTLINIDISNNKNVSPHAVKYVIDHCKHIQTLNLCLCHTIDDDCIQHISIYAKEIKKLLLVGCKLTDAALFSLGKYASNLEHVDVGWCEEITDEGVISISTMCARLKYLGLMRCDKVSDRTMLQLAKQNSHIVYSTFLLDSQRLIAQATSQGFEFKLDDGD
ncbi:F-box/LRR-repeat protein 17-like [Antedon mediterranea]|uniref:F-box/LRR-repeat protein 17-like n=1 Tax=Antedon mediterranea TaxID=105859 RepID=UPI003AF8BD5C